MPELPEVETTKRGLEPHLNQQRIDAVEVYRRDLRWPIPDEFEEVLTGNWFVGFKRIGKYLIMDLSNGVSIIAHLGMSGTFRVEHTVPEILRKHDHVVIVLESGAALIYRDPRRFGFLLLEESRSIRSHPRIKVMGPDPFDSESFTAEYLLDSLRKKKSQIKPILLDQHLVAGIGNIYASEALFTAGIRPDRLALSLSLHELQKLVISIRSVLQLAINSGGSTLRDFTGGDGKPGYFQHAFQVYGREGGLCVGCGQAVDKFVMAGRATYCCYTCQS